MAWKFDEQGNIVLQDGNPVWQGDDGAEVAFDAKANIIAAATAKREAAEARTKVKEAEQKLAAYSGIEDPAKALEALRFAGSMDGKKVMDDDAIKKLIESSVKPWQEKFEAANNEASEIKQALYTEKVSKQFASSKFINEKTLLTPDFAEAYFGKHFKLDNGKVIAHDASGNPIYSTTKAGEVADFEEAISVLISSYPDKDKLLRASGGNGSGSMQSNGTGRQDTSKMSSVDKIKAGLLSLST